jgi:2-deoxy-D-gluconate 3-dehydrogenase
MKISNLFSIENRIAVVTGGSRGIGEMITAGFLAFGVKVYISARKAPALIDKAYELSDTSNQECIPITCDISNMEGIYELSKKLAEQEEGIDFLINNAGAAWGESFETFSEQGWDKVMDLNVKSMFFLTQKLKSHLLKRCTIDDPSRVINIGSIDGLNVPALDPILITLEGSSIVHLFNK